MTTAPETARKPARPDAASRSGPRLTRAIAWMLLALVSFCIIGIAGREASRGITTAQLMFWRGAIGFAVLAVVLAITGTRLRDLGSPMLRLHGLRSIVHFGAQYSWLHAVTLISLAEVFALEFTAPLWVAVLAPFILGERLTLPRIAAAVLGFAGVLVIVRPGGGGGLSEGTMFALASAVGFAVSMICTKRLTTVDPPWRILFWMLALQSIIGLIALARGIIWPDAVTWAWIIAISIAGLAAHYGLARAFTLADAIVVAPMDFLRVPLIAAVGAAVYGEDLDPYLLAGGGVILIGNALNIWGERRRNR